MLSLKYIKENIDLVKRSIIQKNVDCNLDEIIDLDQKRISIIQTVEQMKATRNSINNKISDYKKSNKNTENLISDMKDLSIDIKDNDNELNAILIELNEKLLYVPNIVNEDVPIGDETEYLIIREWGQKPKYDFDIKDHKTLCELNSLVDFKRGAKISGAGFPLYTNKGAKLERSLINFMLDAHASNGYEELFPPFLVSSTSPKTT